VDLNFDRTVLSDFDTLALYRATPVSRPSHPLRANGASANIGRRDNRNGFGWHPRSALGAGMIPSEMTAESTKEFNTGDNNLR